MSKKPTNDNLTTRIIPGLSAQHRIISLPYWAWFWLDDFMQQNRVSYSGIYDTFGQGNDFNQTLFDIAELHHEHAMREVYNLANDNDVEDLGSLVQLRKPDAKVKQSLNLPKIYKLFGFMSCATSLDAVWERRNYEDNNKVN